MNDLVVIENNQTFTTSLTIAEGTGNQHKNVLAMIRKHKAYMEKFDPLAFKTLMGKPLPQGGYGRPKYVAMLTEQQATFSTLALEDEKAVASECGRGLSDWKRKRDGLQQAIESVERQLQPQLTGFEKITH